MAFVVRKMGVYAEGVPAWYCGDDAAPWSVVGAIVFASPFDAAHLFDGEGEDGEDAFDGAECVPLAECGNDGPMGALVQVEADWAVPRKVAARLGYRA